MRYFTVHGRTDREAIDKMKASYGEDARILTHRAVRRGGLLGLFGSDGVEVTGYISEDGARRRKVEVEEEKKKILDSVRREQTLQVLLKEIQGLREAVSAPRPPAREEAHPSVARIEDLLVMNDFTEEYRGQMRERIRREFSLEALEDYGTVQSAVVEWIGDSIAVDPPLAFEEKGDDCGGHRGPDRCRQDDDGGQAGRRVRAGAVAARRAAGCASSRSTTTGSPPSSRSRRTRRSCASR